jgi:phage gp36-like protein
MTYATIAKLTERFGERMIIALTDRGEISTGVMDTSVVDQALSDADAIIDGYLVGRYTLPVSDTPDLLVDLAQSIAIYKLHTSSVPDKIKDDYAGAMRQLRDISDGKIRLSIAGVETATTGASGARITDRERPMTASNLKSFI